MDIDNYDLGECEKIFRGNTVEWTHADADQLYNNGY